MMYGAQSLSLTALVVLGVAAQIPLGIAASPVVAVSVPATSSAPTTTRVSVSADGAQARRDAFLNSMSADGRYVLFDSLSPGLVRGDGSDPDAFVRDRSRQTTTLASVHDGLPGRFSGGASMSIDGRFVGFTLYRAQPTVPPHYGRSDAYVRDMERGTTRPLLPSGGSQTGLDSGSPSISRDGRYVAFVALRVPGPGKHRFNVLLRDRRRGTTRLVSRAFDGRRSNGRNVGAAISANGRYIAFSSNASNIVRHDANGHHSDVFVYDRKARRVVWTTASATVERIGPGRRYLARSNAPSISASGRYVAFWSNSARLVEGDTNEQPDVFVRDLRRNTTQRVSVATGGGQACRVPPKAWERPCNGGPALSPDGHVVAFSSVAPDLVPGDRNQHKDIFVHDTRTQTTTRASLSASGGEICGPFADDCILGGAAVSADGRFVAFSSTDRAVVPDDTNRRGDVFVRGPLP